MYLEIKDDFQTTILKTVFSYSNTEYLMYILYPCITVARVLVPLVPLLLGQDKRMPLAGVR